MIDVDFLQLVGIGVEKILNFKTDILGKVLLFGFVLSIFSGLDNSICLR